jgi:hypothetical protein
VHLVILIPFFTNVPGLNSVCWDWGNRRAQFFSDGQGKRCLRPWSDLNLDYATGYSVARWKEVACDW